MHPKQIAEAYANQVWNEKDLSAIDRYIHPQAIVHSLLGDFKGPQAMTEVVQAWHHALPDLSVVNIHAIYQDDLVVLHWSASGTHKGLFNGLSPSGKNIQYAGTTLYKIQNGKIVEYWAYLDMQHLLNQMKL